VDGEPGPRATEPVILEKQFLEIVSGAGPRVNDRTGCSEKEFGSMRQSELTEQIFQGSNDKMRRDNVAARL